MIQSLLIDIAGRFHLVKKSGKWVGPCPQCGGGEQSDKFNIREDGGFKCYGCDFKGDIITWLRTMEGKSCPEAHAAAGVPCRATSCAVYGTCRLGDGSGKMAWPARRTPLTPPAPAKKEALPISQPRQPLTSWQRWATDLQVKAMAAMDGQKATLTWLASRGIDRAAARRFGLGWQAENGKAVRKDIGLENKDGKATLWVPVGLVIPIFTTDGRIHRLRIRRPVWAREKFLPDLKYVWLEGSGNEPLVIRPAAGEKTRGAVVVEAELDAMAIAAAHLEVMVIALGTVRGPVTDALRQELAALPVILVALDADTGQAGKTGAGPQAVAGWRHDFRQAKFWPVPAGKDPGDYVKEHRGDLRAWVEAGLVPPVAVSVPGHEPMLCPVSIPGGGREAIPDSSPVDEPVNCHEVELTDGKIFYVTNDRQTWRALATEGKAVFSGNELARLQAAVAGGTDEERLAAARAALEVKEVFGGAYIRRGESKQP